MPAPGACQAGDDGYKTGRILGTDGVVRPFVTPDDIGSVVSPFFTPDDTDAVETAIRAHARLGVTTGTVRRGPVI